MKRFPAVGKAKPLKVGPLIGILGDENLGEVGGKTVVSRQESCVYAKTPTLLIGRHLSLCRNEGSPQPCDAVGAKADIKAADHNPKPISLAYAVIWRRKQRLAGAFGKVVVPRFA